MLQIGEYLIVAKVTEPHGMNGWVKLANLSDNPDRFRPGCTFLIQLEQGDYHELTLEQVREAPGSFRAKFAGVEDRDAADDLKGKDLLITEEEAGELVEEDAYWEHQILGLRVMTSAGDTLGEVAEILYTPANEVYVVRGERQYLIPAIRDVVVEVDLERGVMIIEPLPGLLEL